MFVGSIISFACTFRQSRERPAQRGAQMRPALFQFVLIHSLDPFELGLGEAEQFVQVDFRRGFAEQVAVEHQFAASFFSWMPASSLRSMEPSQTTGPDVDRPRRVEPVRPVDALLETVERPRVGGEDDVVAQMETVQFRHAFRPGQRNARCVPHLPIKPSVTARADLA